MQNQHEKTGELNTVTELVASPKAILDFEHVCGGAEGPSPHSL